MKQNHTQNEKQGHQPQSGRNVVIDNQKKGNNRCSHFILLHFPCCTRKQKQFSSSISMLMICTAVALVVVSIVAVAMAIIYRDPELYMYHFVYLAKDLFICCIDPYTHSHYNSKYITPFFLCCLCSYVISDRHSVNLDLVNKLHSSTYMKNTLVVLVFRNIYFQSRMNNQ